MFLEMLGALLVHDWLTSPSEPCNFTCPSEYYGLEEYRTGASTKKLRGKSERRKLLDECGDILSVMLETDMPQEMRDYASAIIDATGKDLSADDAIALLKALLDMAGPEEPKPAPGRCVGPTDCVVEEIYEC